MPKMISDLPAATVIDDADVFAVEQAGVSKKISWGSLRDAVAFEIGTPKKDDLLVMSSISGFQAASDPRWRVVPPLAYVASSASSYQLIAFVGSPLISGVKGRASDYFSVGDPVRVQIGGTYYYCICATTTTTLLYVHGPPLPTGQPITNLAIGTKDMIHVVSLTFDGTGYNTSTSLALTRGCRHRWRGKTGHLAIAAFAHMNTSATVSILVQIAPGTNAFTAGQTMNAGTATAYGVYKENFVSAGFLTSDVTRLKIQHNENITVTTPVITGSADWPIFHLFFVVP